MQLSCKTEHIDGIMAMHVQQHLPDQVFRLYYFSGAGAAWVHMHR